MSKETAKTSNHIPKEQIETIEIHPLLGYYMIILKNHKGVWYAREFIANTKGLDGEFHADRF